MGLKLTPFLNEAFSNIVRIASGVYLTPYSPISLILPSHLPLPPPSKANQDQLTHSVSNQPGNTALTLTFGPWVLAKHLIKCNCAAFVTLYGIELPPVLRPAMLEVIMKTPPSGLLLKVERAAFMRCVCAFTFTAKQVSQSATVGAKRSEKVEKRV
jgi:hypothetical protein